ncbi:glycosyltransferase family 4 protein [Nostoc linckia FACHB-104]|nr:glycosyltransferase family 4 protein [Nostoc linckia FACHB-104]
MEKIANDALHLASTEGRQLIQANYKAFASLVTQAQGYAQQGKYTEAAVYVQMAALYGFWRHSGLFASPELEQVLRAIAQQTIPIYPQKTQPLTGTPRKVLHVASAVQGIGGLGRMIWRWMQQDTKSCHSLVLTQQPSSSVPTILRDAVDNSGGKIYSLNETTIGGILAWAKRLRQIAADADVVVLHIWPDDAIPIIAFANKEQSPPILYLDHADHGFWLGASISDILISLRSSGMRLAQERRGFEAERIGLLPIILPPTTRTLSRIEAKQKLGFDENTVLLLSIARAPKYSTIDEPNFADAHVPLLEKHDNAVLVVIGPGDSEDWSAAVERTQGRIKIFAEREDTAVFYQAADIYVDSFPIISITSLLEAGSYGVPLVTRYPYSDACAILGSDAPGLDEHLLRARNLQQYTAILSRLIEDAEFRWSQGDATSKCIAEKHTGSNWQSSLEEIYAKAMNLPRVTVKSDLRDEMFLGEPDVLLTRIFWNACGHDQIEPENLKKWHMMPFTKRFAFWMQLIKERGVGRNGAIDILLPQWLYWQFRKYVINTVKNRKFWRFSK